MGIEVKHDLPGGIVGIAAAMSGAAGRAERDLDRARADSALSQQLKQQRESQMRDIDARADLQRQAADDAWARTALQFGLDQQIREEEFDRTLRMKQEDAKLQAQQWEYQYTAQQRQEIAKYNNARQTIQNSPNWSAEEKAVALKQIDLAQANIKPSMMPRDPSKPVYPEGQGVGQIWKGDDGSLVSREPDGTIKLIQRWDQGPEAVKLNAEAERQKAELEAQAKREEELFGLRVKLATEAIEETGADGLARKRYRTPGEVDAAMEAVTGERLPWWKRRENAGLQVADMDKDLPEQVGYAQAALRTMNAQYGRNIPSEQRTAYAQLVSVLHQYAQGQQGQDAGATEGNQFAPYTQEIQSPHTDDKASDDYLLRRARKTLDESPAPELKTFALGLGATIAYPFTNVIGEGTGTEKVGRVAVAYNKANAERHKGILPWWKRSENRRLYVNEVDKLLPDEVGRAQAWVRTMNANYGGNIPSNLHREYAEMVRILREYAATEAGR